MHTLQHFLYRALQPTNACAINLYTGQDNTPVQQELIPKMIKKPVVDDENFNRVWEQYVYALKGQYTMND